MTAEAACSGGSSPSPVGREHGADVLDGVDRLLGVGQRDVVGEERRVVLPERGRARERRDVRRRRRARCGRPCRSSACLGSPTNVAGARSLLRVGAEHGARASLARAPAGAAGRARSGRPKAATPPLSTRAECAASPVSSQSAARVELDRARPRRRAAVGVARGPRLRATTFWAAPSFEKPRLPLSASAWLSSPSTRTPPRRWRKRRGRPRRATSICGAVRRRPGSHSSAGAPVSDSVRGLALRRRSVSMLSSPEYCR